MCPSYLALTNATSVFAVWNNGLTRMNRRTVHLMKGYVTILRSTLPLILNFITVYTSCTFAPASERKTPYSSIHLTDVTSSARAHVLIWY